MALGDCGCQFASVIMPEMSLICLYSTVLQVKQQEATVGFPLIVTLRAGGSKTENILPLMIDIHHSCHRTTFSASRSLIRLHYEKPGTGTAGCGGGGGRSLEGRATHAFHGSNEGRVEAGGRRREPRLL